MSDDDTGDGWIGNANAGVTLPSNNDATYNIYLSPLFVESTGAINDAYVVSSLGRNARLWSNTASIVNGPKNALYLTTDDDANNIVRPSVSWWRSYGYSLRCLVSTNNR